MQRQSSHERRDATGSYEHRTQQKHAGACDLITSSQARSVQRLLPETEAALGAVAGHHMPAVEVQLAGTTSMVIAGASRDTSSATGCDLRDYGSSSATLGPVQHELARRRSRWLDRRARTRPRALSRRIVWGMVGQRRALTHDHRLLLLLLLLEEDANRI